MSLSPTTGVEMFVPGRQDPFAMRTPIPLAGAPISLGLRRALFTFEGTHERNDTTHDRTDCKPQKPSAVARFHPQGGKARADTLFFGIRESRS